MSPVTAQIQRDHRTLTITVTGVATRAAIIAVVQEHYPTLTSQVVLWDFSGSDSSRLTNEDFEAIAAAAKAAVTGKMLRKTAYVAADENAYLVACKYLNAAVAARLPVEYAVFTELAAAKAWLARE